MAVHYRDAAGEAVIIPVDAAIAHPRYRADAIQARVQSIDLALISTARPLDPRFVGASIGDGGPPPIGAPAIVSGYGASREGDWSSGGILRSVTLAVREPASTVLIWAADPGRTGGRRLQRRFRRAGLVGRRIDRNRHRRLGPGAARPRLRRPDPGPAARAGQGLDRGDRAQLVTARSRIAALNGAQPAYRARASSASAISSSAFGSSIVAGVVQASWSAIFFIVPRRILPERVFGRRGTTIAILNAATGPILSRTSVTTSFSISSAAG